MHFPHHKDHTFMNHDELPDDGSTQANERLQSPLGALLRRVMAFIYDCLLLVAILFIVTAAALTFNDGQAIHHPLYSAFMALIAWLFFDWFWRHGGQTLGMRAWHLKLVDDTQAGLNRWRTLLRCITGTLLFGFTLLTVPFDRERRAIHDGLTRTRIIRVRRQ